MRAMVRAVLEAFLEGLRPFLMEGVELFELFGSQDLTESGHPVNTVFKQGLVRFEHLRLGGIDTCSVLAFESFAQSPFGFVLLLTENLENGIAFHAASLDGCLLFRRYLQQGIHGGKVRAFELRPLFKITVRAHVLVFAIFMLGAVRAMAGLSVLFARTRQALGAVAGGIHRAVFTGGALFTTGHAHAATATVAFECSQEKS